jgi:UDP-N-acetylglucosamine 2-epimerase (non-hydrolysing)/GDP/UDP-N,N'-diacetylbacillosamine 2-epimerase (hydrolysing)
MESIQRDRALRLQVVVTGMHLSGRLGKTVDEVEAAGVRIDRRVDMDLNEDSGPGNAKAIGRGVAGFADAFSELRPAILVLLGDRFELFSPAIAALMLRIPIAHIHGGERTEGAIDEAVRHAITKMASLHFAATEEYRKRIIQMGEMPSRTFNFGAPGLDELFSERLMTQQELESDLGVSLDDHIAIVTYHPETQEVTSSREQIRIVLSAIEKSPVKAVFTMANADAGGQVINQAIQKFCSRNPKRFKLVANMGRRRYLSCLQHFRLMIGNSSSGLVEGPSFKIPVVNIGDRQRGRVRGRNTIDVTRDDVAIRKGIERALSSRFRASLRGMKNPYDRFHDGRTSERIKNVLKDVDLPQDFLKKSFNDLRGRDL